MKTQLGGPRLRETLASMGIGLFGSVLLGLSWLAFFKQPLMPGMLALGIALTGGIVLVDRFPIHLRYATKVSITSVALYMTAMLLPQPLAVTCAALGMTAAGVLAREERGLLATDIVFDAARWVIIVSVGSGILNLPIPAFIPHNLLLILAAAGMFLSDILTFSVYTSIIAVQQSLLVLVRETLLHAYAIESIQYMIGLLGVLAFYQAPWALLLLILTCAIVHWSFKRLMEIQQGTREILERTADAVDQRDPFTGFHSKRVEKLTRLIVEQLNIYGTEAELICLASRLHDIGKGVIPIDVLHKPGKLTEDEWVLVKRHPESGAQMVSQFPDFNRGAQMILAHHERWDGKGYPRGLKGPDIPLGARLIAVADAFDAMTSDRPYRRRLTRQEAIQRLVEGRGSQWDPLIVDALLACIDKEDARAQVALPLGHTVHFPLVEKP